jgi:SAM-dependent methyltransferase
VAGIHEAARRGFEREADAYERGRPGYPPEVTEWVVRTLGLGRGRTVVDIGAGTGKLTRALLPSGAEVIAVEPVAEMRAVLERELREVRALEGTAESLPLDDASADAIVVGQAFHWFDAAAALAEFHRVLRASGRLGLLWNLRDRKQDLQRAIDEITEPLRGDTPSQSSGAWRSALEQSPLFALTAELRVPFELELSCDTFVDRVASVSFVAALDDGPRAAVLERVNALASEHREPWVYTAEAYVYERTEES